MNYQNYPNYQQAYQPNYPNYQQAFQPYYQQIQQLQNQIQQSQQTNQNGGMFYFVNSQKEVEDWVLNAGQTAFFFERNASVFYIKSVAQNGLSQPIEVYDYSQRLSDSAESHLDDKGDKYITRDEFEALKAELEALKEAEG
jgi:hypothetical protein